MNDWRERLESHARACRGEAGTLISPADLRWANLRSADLSLADLRLANLSSADLRLANLSSADLRLADLRWANLSSANLSSANLRWANLSSADLRLADLSSANLSLANLSSADLRLADLPQIVYVGPVGSRHDVLMLHIPDMTFRAGCWTGTRDRLIERLDSVYPNGPHRSTYLAAISALEAMAISRKEGR